MKHLLSKICTEVLQSQENICLLSLKYYIYSAAKK